MWKKNSSLSLWNVLVVNINYPLMNTFPSSIISKNSSCFFRSIEYSSLSSKNVDIPLAFSPVFVLKNHQAFEDGISSLLSNRKDLHFFADDHFEKKQFNRPVLLQTLNIPNGHEDQCDDCRRRNISLIDMKLNHIHEDHQISLWIVTQPQPTNLVDGTFYVVVRDQHDHHIRLSKSLHLIFESRSISSF